MSAKTLRTSRTWWESVLTDEASLISWLQSQHYGEVTASERITTFAECYCGDARHRRVLEVIAAQERDHAAWVGGLLRARGVALETPEKAGRYWEKTLPGVTDFHAGAAVASHAEGMRLLRIKVIADHPETPPDIRAVFAKILPQELFHERAFADMAGSVAMKETAGAHKLGMEALGITI